MICRDYNPAQANARRLVAVQNHLLRMKKVGCEIAQPGKAPVYDGH